MKNLLLLAGGAVAVYLLWPKKGAAATQAPFPSISVAPIASGTSGSTGSAGSGGLPTIVSASPAASRMLPDTYEATGGGGPSYDQQAQMTPDELARSILTQGLDGYDGGKGPSFAGGWWL